MKAAFAHTHSLLLCPRVLRHCDLRSDLDLHHMAAVYRILPAPQGLVGSSLKLVAFLVVGFLLGVLTERSGFSGNRLPPQVRQQVGHCCRAMLGTLQVVSQPVGWRSNQIAAAGGQQA